CASGAVQQFVAVINGLGASAFPLPRTEEVRPTNLPAGIPVPVRREEDVARVRNAVELEHVVDEVAPSFNAMADSIQRLVDARRELVSSVSHDLRTPVGSMRVILEAL